jgi:hypothetical protein
MVRTAPIRLPYSCLEQLAQFGRVARDGEAALFHDGQLGVGRVGAAGDQRAGVAHALAGRGGHAGDEADDGLLHVGLAPAGGFGFVGAADFADHDHGIGVRIVVEGRITSMCFRPLIGSPPMPTAVDWPRPTSVSMATAS